ncbi:MAG: aquaporin [Thiotrichales bacterium]|nr:aquaporin [Thiotrichales bacterium]
MNKNYFAEFLGTFMMVFAGTAAIVVNDVSGGVITHVGVSLVFGLAVAAVIYSLGDISGAHINPAVTIAFWYAHRFPGRQVTPYIIFQVLGALAASTAVRLLFPDHQTLGATLPSGPVLQSFFMEILLTFFLMSTIINVTATAKEEGVVAGAIIGGMVALAALFAGPVSGASMNPARSIGPAIISGDISVLWIYLAAPVMGALLAIPCCRCVRQQKCCG